MDYQKLSETVRESILGLQKLLIVIKGSPDPDVLASSFALKILCESAEVEATIVSLRDVSLLQNRAIIQKLDIPVHFIKRIFSVEDYDGYAVLDHQSAWVDDIGADIPCVLHIDHHTEEKDKIEPRTRIISEEAGSVSTMMSFVLQKTTTAISSSVLRRLTTALYLGIKTDTDNFQIATPADLEAAAWLNLYVDREALSEMENIAYSEETITVISKAVMNEYVYKDWIFCGVGYISERHRDSIAITADYLLKNEDVSGAVVFALIEKDHGKGLFLDASIRTIHKSLDLNSMAKHISPEGGGRSFKGAYQVNLDYFAECPDRGIVWEAVRLTTHERLRRRIDQVSAITLGGVFYKLKKKVFRFFDQNQ
jgi:nanoRNase/pAp phosphatase (c-di-AMP/oligoRNAs hydrolase)